MLATRRLKKRSLLKVNEHFSGKQSIKYDSIATIISPTTLISCQKGLDLAICRRMKKRSLLEVNEHFSDKQSVKDDPLSQEIHKKLLVPGCVSTIISRRTLDNLIALLRCYIFNFLSWNTGIY